MKAKVTWKGVEGEGDEQVNQARGVTFKKGEAVETEDEALIQMATGHPHFEVQVLEGGDDKSAPAGPVEVQPAPSQVGAQRPVPKPGEPMPASPTPQAKK